MEMGIWGPNELHNCVPLNTNKILLCVVLACAKENICKYYTTFNTNAFINRDDVQIHDISSTDSVYTSMI